MSHWMILPVVLPALSGAFILLALRHDLMVQRAVGLVASFGLLAVAIALLIAGLNNPPEMYKLGNWPAPFGIVLMLDGLSGLMLVLTGLLAVAVQFYVIGSGWDKEGKNFHALFQFQLMGISGAFLTGDAFNLFVFFEVLLIASYGLMIHGGGRDRLKAGVQYVGFNLIGSSLFLIALATIYAVTGTLNIADLAVKAQLLTDADAGLFRAAAILLLLVFAIKGALVPLQFWLPGTYANAPGPVAALFAIMTKIGAYAIIRFGVMVFPPSLAVTGDMIQSLLLPAAIATLVLGALGVLGAKTLPKLAAFSAIASMGNLFIAVAGFTPQSTAAALYYLLHSTLAGAALFLIGDLLIRRRGSNSLQAPAQVVAGQGLIAGLFMAIAVACAGMPPLSGFLGKLMILQSVPDHRALVWTVVLLSSFTMILGFARAGSVLFWKSHAVAVKSAGKSPARPRPEGLSIVAIGALIAGLVALTIFAGPVTQAMQAIADALHDPSAYIAANSLPQEG